MSSIPIGWLDVELGEIAQLIRGVTYKREQSADAPQNGFLPVLRATNINGIALTFDGLVYVPAANISTEQLLLPGDVVIASSSGSKEIVGKGGSFVGGSFVGSFGAFCTGLRPSGALSPAYFRYYFQTPSYRKSVSELSAGSNINNLKPADLASQNFPLPPAPEQIRIVEKLEELLSDLDAGVAELKAAQKKLGQYRQALLKAAVDGALTAEWRAARKVGAGDTAPETGAQLLERILTERRARWETKQLAKFAEQGKSAPKDWQKKYPEPVQLDTSDLPELPEGWVWASIEQIASDDPYSLAIGPFGSNLKVSDYREDGVPLVFVRNIRSGNYGGVYTKYVTQEKAEALSAHSIAAGDVLITKMGEPPGDADVYPEDQSPAIITADCIKVRCWTGLMHPGFLKTVINSYIGQRQIGPMTQGVAQKKVSLGRFTSLAVPIPSIQEQDQLMELVSMANIEAVEQEVAIEISLKQSAAQRKNILRAAFSGQLVPQDPNDEPASVLLERIRAERVERDKQPKVRKPKQQKEIAAMVSKLIDVLAEAGDWLPAQEAFRRCGVADGAQTEQLEALYAELRALDKAGRLAVEPVTDTQGRKLHDRLKLLAA